MYKVLYTKIYNKLYTVPSSILYTNPKVAVWSFLVLQEHSPSWLLYIVAKHSNEECNVQHTLQYAVYCTVNCTLQTQSGWPFHSGILPYLPPLQWNAHYTENCTMHCNVYCTEYYDVQSTVH